MTDTQPTDPAWIFEGAEVAVTTGGRYGTMTYETIARMTATTIVLTDGRRYRRGGTNGHGQIGGNRSFPSTSLVDPKSPNVVAYFARAQYREVLRLTEQPTRPGAEIHLDKMTPEQIRQALLELTDQIRTAVKEIDRRAGL